IAQWFYCLRAGAILLRRVERGPPGCDRVRRVRGGIVVIRQVGPALSNASHQQTARGVGIAPIHHASGPGVVVSRRPCECRPAVGRKRGGRPSSGRPGEGRRRPHTGHPAAAVASTLTLAPGAYGAVVGTLAATL